jgi:hypothetical protein
VQPLLPDGRGPDDFKQAPKKMLLLKKIGGRITTKFAISSRKQAENLLPLFFKLLFVQSLCGLHEEVQKLFKLYFLHIRLATINNSQDHWQTLASSKCSLRDFKGTCFGQLCWGSMSLWKRFLRCN